MLSSLKGAAIPEHAQGHAEFGAEFVWADTQGCAALVKQSPWFSPLWLALVTDPVENRYRIRGSGFIRWDKNRPLPMIVADRFPAQTGANLASQGIAQGDLPGLLQIL